MIRKIFLFISLIFVCQSGLTKIHPGAMKYSETLQNQINTALESKGSDYKPRTRHLDRNGHPMYTNRLILEDSPYLLQHAHNPVNWYPWGKEAFDQAKKENKPVFLSIGYATCHWCHVMEEESFENVEIAKQLNENFIAIKVDREQHPDVDETYMTAVMMMTGSGGWPMSSFLLPDGKPFFGGTYYPPANFTELINKVSQAWEERNDQIVAQAEELSAAVQQATSTRSAVQELGQNVIKQAVESVLSRYDPLNGGFSQAPKFPNEPSLLLLLQTAKSDQKSEALEHTLSAMAQGGIYDQVGGGFHRYSTDDRWLVPHFEKMLYNQAYLARVYAEAWRQNGNPLHARIARQTLDYVLREMTATNNGGFYSATDADSEGEEGIFFLWSEKEIRSLLNKEDADFVIRLYGITTKGNFEGKNILHLPKPLTEFALQEGIELADLLTQIDRINETLRKQREKRIPPLTDDKIIVAWNGMMITALAEVGDILNEDRYIEVAMQSADFLWKKQRPAEGKLWRVNLRGKSSIAARQEDYAHFGEALLELYDVTGEQKWLDRAQMITDEMMSKFLDKKSGAFVMGTDEILFAQPKSTHDGATPSGNSVAVRLLSRLARRTGKLEYEDVANRVFNAFSGSIAEFPASYAYMLAQLDELLNGEISARQYAARGAIRMTGQIENSKEHQYDLVINMNMAEGWHINAEKTLQKDLIPTKISVVHDDGWELESPQYPEAFMKKLDFEEQPLALYQGKIQIRAKLKPKAKSNMGKTAFPVNVSVQIQACNKEACLAPETVNLSITRPADVSGS